MLLPILLILVGVGLAGGVAWLASMRQEKLRYKDTLPATVMPVNLMDNDNGIVVAEGRGHVVFANPTARHWFGMNGNEPNLELMAETVQPTSSFLELFGKEGQSSFRIGTRRVEATSHYIPKPDTSQMVIVIREMDNAVPDQDTLDPVRAMNVVSAIAQAISGDLTLGDTLDSILNSIAEVIAFDAGEITLWDEDMQILRPLGKRGDVNYFDEFNRTDGVYHIDDSYSGWLARYRQPLLIGDVNQRPDVHPKLKSFPFTALIGMPLIVGERFIGTLELASRKRAAFNHEDMALLQAIAGQAAIAIENSRLHQSQAERVAELSGLQEIASAMTALRDPHLMYGQLTTRIAGLMNAEMCGVLLFNAEQQALLSQIPFYGVPDAIITMYRIPAPENGPVRAIYDSRDWWYSNNVKADDLTRQTGLAGLAEAVGVRTTALVPMAIGERRFGVVQVSNKRDGSGFSENDMRLLAVFASQAAIVVENARLYEEEQHRADELGGLQQISQAIGVLRDTSELYSQISERIAKLTNVQISGVLLLDTVSNLLIAQTPFYGVSSDLVPYYQIPINPVSRLGKLYNERDFLIFNDPASNPAAQESKLDKLSVLLGMRRLLLVPLIAAGHRLGAIQTSNKIDGTEFTEDDARVLAIFVSQAAVIIDNARLYREMRQRADESERLRRIAEVASSNIPLEELLKVVLRETALLLDADVTAVALLDELTGQLTMRPDWTFGLDGQFNQLIKLDAYAPGFESSAVISRRAFLSNNVRLDGRVLPMYRALADRFELVAVLQVPLVVRDRSVGELTAAHRDEKDFSQGDMRLAQAVALQISAAMERSELYQRTDADLRVRVDQLDALTRVSNELNLTIQLERILDVIRSEAQRTTNADSSTVIKLRPAEEWEKPDVPELEERYGLLPDLDGLAVIEQRAIAQQTLISIPDYASSDDLPAQPAAAKSAVALPIMYGEQPVGAIYVYSRTADAFPPQAQEFLKALANQAAIAVGNNISYRQQLERAEQLRQRAEQISHIFELGRMLRSEEKIENVLEAVAQGITEAVGFNIVVVSLLDPKTQTLRNVAQSGLTLTVFEERKKNETPLTVLEEKIFQPKYRISGSFFLPSQDAPAWMDSALPIQTYKMSVTGRGPNAWNPEDLLLIPLRDSSNELIGMISADDPRDGKRPTLQTVEALEVFANQAAFAVENYQLVQDFQSEADSARRERDSLERLHVVASEIQRAADVPTRLKVVADGIRAAGWSRVAITLRDQNLEARETITSGYSEDEEAALRGNLLSGMVWSQRLSDPDFRRYRVGQAYYLRGTDQWATENKRIAGNVDVPGETPSEGPADPTRWYPLDTVYMPLYGLDRSRLIGIISMDSPVDDKAPTETSMRPIELFATHAASAIENTRLYEETIRAAQQESRINEIMEAVASTLDLNEIIQGIASGLRDMIAYTRMSIALVVEDEPTFAVRRINIGLRGEMSVDTGDPIPVENSAVGLAVSESLTRVYHLADADSTPDYADLKAWRNSGERTSMIVPMIAGGRVTGALHMGSELTSAFGFEEQLPLVARMANLAAIAIENAQLFQQTIDRERFSSALGRVGQTASSMVDLNSVLETVCREGVIILEVDAAYVWLVEGGELVSVAASGQIAETLLGKHKPLGEDTLDSTVVRENTPIIANDIGQPGSRWQHSVFDKDVIRAALGIPLLREEKAIGGLIFVNTELGHVFSNIDMERALTFAAQSSIAIDNARLYQETETRARQLSVLTEVSGQLTATLEPDAVVQILLDRLASILQFDSVTLWLRRGDQLVIRAAQGYADAQSLVGIEADIADSALFRELASRGQVLNIPDITKDPRFPLSTERPTRSWLGVSLVSRGNLAGLLVLEKSDVGYYSPTMEQLALTFANQAAVSLENARLFQETTRAAEENTRLYRETAERARTLDQQARRLALLNRVSGLLTQSLDIEDIFDVTLRELVEVLSADHGGAVLFDADQPNGRVIFEYPRGNEPPANAPRSLDRPSLFDELRQTMQPVVINDVANDPRLGDERIHMMATGMLSTIAIPLTIGGQLIGSLGFEALNERRDFTPEQVEVAQTIAAQAAIAVQNANLYKQSLMRTVELETLFDATQATQNTLNFSEVLYNSAMQVAIALQADSCEILTWDEISNSLIVDIDIDIQSDSQLIDPAGTVYDLAQYPILDRAMRARQMILMRKDDPNLSVAERQLLERRQSAARIVLPMVVREQSIGLIEIETRKSDRQFSATDVRLARTLAAQAGVAIDNARLQTETASKLEELFAINELSTALAATIDQEQIIKIVRTGFPKLIKAQIWLLAVLEEDQLTVSYPIAFKDGEAFAIADRPLGNDEVSYVIKRRTAQRLAGQEMDEILRNVNVKMQIVPSRCFLGVPLISSEEVVGALVLADEENPRAFNLDTQRVLSTVGAQIAVSFQNARLFARTQRFTSELREAVEQRTLELQRERDRIDFLYRITTGLTSSLDTEMVLTRALDMIIKSVQADMGAILGIDSVSENLVYRTTLNMPMQPNDRSMTFRQSEGLPGWIIQTQQSVIVNDVQNDPRWLKTTPFDDEPQSAIATLLEANGDVYGVVMIYSRERNKFNDDQLLLVSAAANQIASAMNNAELYSLVREQAERLGAMVRREQIDSTKNLAIVSSIADGVMVADKSGDITQFNSAAERILGMSRMDVMDHHISELGGLYARSGGRRWLDAIQRWTDEPGQHQPGEELEVELELDNAKFVRVVLSPVNMGDQFLGTVSVIRDITREIEVDRMKTEFVGRVSHELRTPMTSIKGYADLLLIGVAGSVNDQQQRFLTTIKSNADKLSELVNKLLEVSRVDRGIIRLNLIPLDVTEVIETSLHHLNERIQNESKDITVVTNIPDDLPTIRADSEKITQVFNNLMDNAFTYTQAGGTITLTAWAEPRSVVISVADTGIGIAADKQDLIWNRFYRDEDQSMVIESSGSGLGLSIAKEYINMHDGEIWLRSEVNKGTTFFVRIPTYILEESGIPA